MGVSSYITTDTRRSIPVAGLAPCPTFPVHMVGPAKNGVVRIFREEAYAGYQRFGGQCVAEFAALINGVEPTMDLGSMSLEDVGWAILHDSASVDDITIHGFEWKLPLVYPQFVESLDSIDALDFHKTPTRCPDQGWFLDPDGKGGSA